MNRGVFRGLFVAMGFVLVLFLFFAPGNLAGQNVAKGNIIGFIYAKDGATPFEGAVVKFKSLMSGTVYESTKSDTLGVFKVQGVETGIYTYGVVTEAGDFNADNLVGLQIAENDTAKLSIALDPYEKEVASAVSEVFKDQGASGESLVATIADYDSRTSTAQVQMLKGLLRVNDRIHAKGKSTDFYQDVSTLMVGNNTTRQILTGQTGDLRLDRSAQRGDLVYVVRDKKVFPFFLAPAGVATLIAGNLAVTSGVVKIKDEGTPVSAIKN